MKKKEISNSSVEKLTDEELSRRLGKYQKMEDFSVLPGVLCVIAGCILAFVKGDVILLSILVFGGVGLIVFVGLPAQKKKRALLNQQMGGFFRAELDRLFGSMPETPELPIDRSFLEQTGLLSAPWDSFSGNGFYEGDREGLHFSAANLELQRMVEEKAGSDHENWMTRMVTVFKGVVIRCRDLCDPALDLTVSDRLLERKKGELTDPEEFRRWFSARTANGRPADDLVTPELCTLCRELEKTGAGRVRGLVIRSGSLSVALETKYLFATIPEGFDMRDVKGIRKWYTATLTGMCELLDLLKRDSVPLAAGKKE